MTRGRTQRGRRRTQRSLLEIAKGRPLLRTTDHGASVRIDAGDIGASGDRWVQPFLDANRTSLDRLGVASAVDARAGVAVQLTPGPRIGAVPLLSPSTRRVAAGLLVEPRFRWSALGVVLGDIGFATEPTLGGTPLVPGSAREVPAWLLAAPVLRRLEAYLRYRKRGFVVRQETRRSPRGRVDWSRWARQHVPRGQWATLPCHFPEPDDDPNFMAAVRWTLDRLDDELAAFQEATAARLLRLRVADLRLYVGEGDARRPSTDLPSTGSDRVADAVQAMGWVVEERGLGGARVLDGMSWDLPIDEVWEAWVDAFIADLAPRCGLVALRRGTTGRALNWTTRTRSMRLLVPDSGLEGPGRIVWVDAKYKAHLQHLARRGWSGLAENQRDAHRADLHQALAYAALDSVDRIDSLLVYPDLRPDDHGTVALANVSAGRRQIRLALVGLPFGFRSANHREQSLAEWRELLVS